MDAAIALGRNKMDKALEPLQGLLANDPSPRVREAAARALGLLAAPGALKALEMAAQADNDKDVRHSAQFAAEVIRGAAKP
jgi:HEAT repeat protein